MGWDWDKLKEKYQNAHTDAITETFRKKFKFKPWMYYTAFVVSWVLLFLIFWNVARWVNYKFSYESTIQQKIIEMVKPEALKEKYRR